MIRDKDKQLAESCGRMAQASVDALLTAQRDNLNRLIAAN